MTSMHVLETQRRVVADDAAPAATMATNTIASVLMLIESLRVGRAEQEEPFLLSTLSQRARTDLEV